MGQNRKMDDLNKKSSVVSGEITYSDVPFVISNSISDWPLLKFTIEDWLNVFGDEQLQFRKGNNYFLPKPYWERLCDTEMMTLGEFLQVSESTLGDNWQYFDYKYMKNVFDNNLPVLEGVNWSNLGFQGTSGKDSTIWIGNKGAHTPCHRDSYGVNLVAQIYGRKRWILIEPSETRNLKPTRVPYEESSVYSLLNFYTPNSDILGVKNAYEVILEPGEVLYVPRHWWHYVENLQVSISINTWIPVHEDHESRVEEALIQSYVTNIVQELTENDASAILNPNEMEKCVEPFDCNLLQTAILNCREYRKNKIKEELKCPISLKEKREPVLIDMNDYLKEKERVMGYQHISTNVSTESWTKLTIVKLMINSFCHPEAISITKEKLLEMSEDNGDSSN